MKKNGILALLLAALMLLVMVGCGDDATTDPHAGHDHATTTTADAHAGHNHATTTTGSGGESGLSFDEIISLSVEKNIPAGARAYNDASVEESNYTLKLTAIADLTQVQLISINPETSKPDAILHGFSGLKKGQSQYLLTYVNDAAPTRGIVCTDTQGKRWYYAFLCSGKSGHVYLGSFDPEH